MLDGRAIEVSVGSADQGFQGTGLLGYDNVSRSHWYLWLDTTTTGVELFRGQLAADGTGWLEGGRQTTAGREKVRVEVRREGAIEIHDYFALHDGQEPWRFLELRYQAK